MVVIFNQEPTWLSLQRHDWRSTTVLLSLQQQHLGSIAIADVICRHHARPTSPSRACLKVAAGVAAHEGCVLYGLYTVDTMYGKE